MLGNLAEASCELGRFGEVFEAWALDYLGSALLQAGRAADAARPWRRATALFDALHDPRAISLRTRLSSLPESG